MKKASNNSTAFSKVSKRQIEEEYIMEKWICNPLDLEYRYQ